MNEKHKKETKMRLGRIEFNMGYVVDLDNEDMVWHAKEAIADDVMSVVQGGRSIPLNTITEGKFVVTMYWQYFYQLYLINVW